MYKLQENYAMIKALREKQSRDNRQLLNKAADMMEELLAIRAMAVGNSLSILAKDMDGDMFEEYTGENLVDGKPIVMRVEMVADQ